MHWTSLDTWIVAAGVLSAVACALLGNFLVLRRMSMMGDAISHAVLPGLAVAFLVTGSRDSLTMFVGAALAGLLTALFTQWVHSAGQVEESAAMGVVFTLLFAVGLVLMVRAADHVDLDPGCVLYGAIELVPLDTVHALGMEIPVAVRNLAIVCGLNAIFVVLCYKELKLTCFDGDLATTLGFNAHLMHYLLMALVAVTTVASFESVGSILVIAMLIVPPATAYLMTERLGMMIVLSIVFAATAAVLGHLAAITVPSIWGYSSTNTAGMIAAVAGLMFAVAFLVSPRQGMVSRLVHRLRLSGSVLREDILGLLYRIEETREPQQVRQDVSLLRKALRAGPLTIRLALSGLTSRGQVALADGGYQLTDAGRAAARQIIRSHRLWESYLSDQLQLPDAVLHARAEQLEHITDADLQEQLARSTNQPAIDPQGKPIPGGSRGNDQ